VPSCSSACQGQAQTVHTSRVQALAVGAWCWSLVLRCAGRDVYVSILSALYRRRRMTVPGLAGVPLVGQRCLRPSCGRAILFDSSAPCSASLPHRNCLKPGTGSVHRSPFLDAVGTRGSNRPTSYFIHPSERMVFGSGSAATQNQLVLPDSARRALRPGSLGAPSPPTFTRQDRPLAHPGLWSPDWSTQPVQPSVWASR